MAFACFKARCRLLSSAYRLLIDSLRAIFWMAGLVESVYVPRLSVSGLLKPEKTLQPLGTPSGQKCYLCVRCGQGWFGAGDGTRTRDVQLGKLAFFQLNYSRSIGTSNIANTSACAPGQNRQPENLKF